jgi:multiple sugar transport system ATP-binding protein
LAGYEGKQVVLGIRPEDLDDASLARFETSGVIGVTVDIREDMGAEVFAHFRVDADAVESQEVLEAMEEDDVPGAVRERMRGGVPFIGRLERGTRAREGDRLDVAVDRRLRCFDLKREAGSTTGRVEWVDRPPTCKAVRMSPLTRPGHRLVHET